jgi:hypothetical protein
VQLTDWLTTPVDLAPPALALMDPVPGGGNSSAGRRCKPSSPAAHDSYAEAAEALRRARPSPSPR